MHNTPSITVAICQISIKHKVMGTYKSIKKTLGSPLSPAPKSLIYATTDVPSLDCSNCISCRQINKIQNFALHAYLSTL